MIDSENASAVKSPTSLRVLMPNGRAEEMKLETYLAGVVATEIGASAPLEALKAQAVAARTYAAAAHRHPEHEADVCTTAHCQKWKRVDPVVAPEVFRALSETWGMVAIFEGKLIDAFFFEHCDGHTRNSEDMLMPTVNYLRGVDCSCGFLSLKGHGVGMCKRGAIVLARRGASFEQILRHYYRGVVVIHTERDSHGAPEVAVEVEAPPAAKPRARARKTVEPAKPAAEKPRVRRKPRVSTLRAPAPRWVETPPTAVEAVRVPAKPVERPVPPAAEEKPVITEPQTPLPAAPSIEQPREVMVGEIVKSEAAEPARTKPARRVHIDHLPGSRMIAGCMPNAGMTVLIEDGSGNKAVVLSGSAAHYGEGGFEMIVDADGRYLVTIEDQVVEVHVHGETVFIHAT